jgi:hypothetical protein
VKLKSLQSLINASQLAYYWELSAQRYSVSFSEDGLEESEEKECWRLSAIEGVMKLVEERVAAQTQVTAIQKLVDQMVKVAEQVKFNESQFVKKKYTQGLYSLSGRTVVKFLKDTINSCEHIGGELLECILNINFQIETFIKKVTQKGAQDLQRKLNELAECHTRER